MMAALISAGVTCPVTAEERVQRPPYDRRVLSEIARDVLRRGATGANQSVPQRTSPGGRPEPESAVVESASDVAVPATDISPVREGITVPIEPESRPPKKAVPAEAAAAGYHSNSWRQRPDTARGLSFSSARLAPASGLDPALKAHAGGLRAQGRQFVYGFLLLRVPPHEPLQMKLAGLDVELLGPHDDHHKAHLPVASLQAIAALPEVEWVGVSAPEQKLSSELSALRGLRGQAAVVDPGDPIPIVINLFEGDDNGNFRRQLEAAGAMLGEYHFGLHFYRAVATGPVIDRIIALDFVLFIDLIGLTSPAHDQSTPLVDADLIRPGTTTYGVPRFSGSTIPVGILDSGFMMGAPDGHDDLYFKEGCGRNFTDDGLSTFTDEIGHGTHVLGTIAGTGSADSRYRGMAPGVGLPGGGGIRAAKIWKSDPNSGSGGSSGNSDVWMVGAMDWMALANECNLPAPLVINISGGHSGTGQTGAGSDNRSKTLDYHVWINRQLYVVAAGNDGPNGGTINTPGVAKNALTVGNVFDYGDQTVGDIADRSSRGPTGDGRMKPNVVAPGQSVTSAEAGSRSEYVSMLGTSMATPHVTGLAATLMEHYPSFQFDPAMMRAHLMATAIAHDDVTGKSTDYGLGRVDAYLAHWDHPNTDGWSNYWFSGYVDAYGYQYRDVTVPPGTKRLVVVLTWDEPPASSGASRAVMYDLDLWVDRDASCGDMGNCGEYKSVSSIDNVEYIVVDNPPAGTYRMKVFPYNAPGITLPYGLAATVIRGSPSGDMTAYIEAPSNATVGSRFPVTMHLVNYAYVASAVQVKLVSPPPGVRRLSMRTTRLDGVTMDWITPDAPLTLGTIPPSWSRYATWYVVADTPGPKTFTIRASSENGNEVFLTKTVQVDSVTNLVETAMATNPSAPLRAPGTTFSVTDTVQNIGIAPSASSTTRYYLSLDATKSADDTLLSGTHSVPTLNPGASHTATITVTIPAVTSSNSYFLLACADDKNAIVESNEGDNCMASPGAIVTVARADLVETAATMNPPTPIRAPATTFSVTDTVRNLGPVASAPSTTRYYLSLDPVKGAGDALLVGSRAVPGLATGAVHSGTVTVTIPTTTPLNTYFLLACADDLAKVTEGDETNNCVASPTAAVTVTRPDLVDTAVSAPPATKQRGTTFTVTDTAQNIGAVASGASATRYYLSLDAVKSAGDTLLSGSRAVPGLAAGASHTGSVTLTIPTATLPNTYFLLACADGGNAMVETDETNNCKASGSTVTVTP